MKSCFRSPRNDCFQQSASGKVLHGVEDWEGRRSLSVPGHTGVSSFTWLSLFIVLLHLFPSHSSWGDFLFYPDRFLCRCHYSGPGRGLVSKVPAALTHEGLREDLQHLRQGLDAGACTSTPEQASQRQVDPQSCCLASLLNR